MRPICEKNLEKLKENEPGYKRLKNEYLKYLAIYFNNEGLIYRTSGNLPVTLEFLHKGLKILEEIGDKQGIAMSFNNLGGIYSDMKDHDKAFEYYQKSLKLQEEIKDDYGMGISYNSIGNIYRFKHDYKNALIYFEKALKTLEKYGEKSTNATLLNNIGFVYDEGSDYETAFKYYNQSLKIREEIGDVEGLIESYGNMGYVFSKKKEYQKAEGFFVKSMKLSKEQGFPENIQLAANWLYGVYKAQNKSDKALEMYELFILMRDSIISEKAKTSGIKKLIQYEYDKKAMADSILVVEEKKVTQVQLKQEQTQRYALYGGLVIVLVFAGFMFNRFKVTQKQNLVIEGQKQIVEEKQREILDSIHYAKRIQNSLLPREKYIEKAIDKLNKN